MSFAEPRMFFRLFRATAKRLYYFARKTAESSPWGTKVQQWIWSRKSALHGDFEQAFERTLQDPHRRLLLDAVARVESMSSILEVGCGTGPNLFLIAKAHPRLRVSGVDINAKEVDRGLSWMQRQRLHNVEMWRLSERPLEGMESQQFDVVFSDAVLMYVGPDRIRQTLSEMLRVASQSVFLNEWLLKPSSEETAFPSHYHYGHWVHDYVGLIRLMAPSAVIKATPHPDSFWQGKDASWTKYGHFVEVRL